ncbi:hypothetical protein [Mycobacterium noviomagense]|uniref:Uncharacterized protein n=1 Tax=Mycobacterium noviomagense TaxID=459858 RepID=A0A7I7PHS6_9MYCO|nr:hypothetical protein [Mycobacterium noviomagense]ORB16767.1 hypothetical protein BST37_05600 [Mycobacterium noviomagense]BBY08112.1 hypothetical protein MNVI_34300 [Mycobacterium noviomagense]
MTNFDDLTQWSWLQAYSRFTLQNQDERQLYEVAESGADHTGTWHFKRNEGLSVGPLLLGSVISYRHPTADAAKAAAEEDFRQIVQLGKWLRYMVTHNPPA